MFNDSHFREGGTNLGSFPVGGWLTTPTSPPVYGPDIVIYYKRGGTKNCGYFLHGSLKGGGRKNLSCDKFYPVLRGGGECKKFVAPPLLVINDQSPTLFASIVYKGVIPSHGPIK